MPLCRLGWAQWVTWSHYFRLFCIFQHQFQSGRIPHLRVQRPRHSAHLCCRGPQKEQTVKVSLSLSPPPNLYIYKWIVFQPCANGLCPSSLQFGISQLPSEIFQLQVELLQVPGTDRLPLCMRLWNGAQRCHRWVQFGSAHQSWRVWLVTTGVGTPP